MKQTVIYYISIEQTKYLPIEKQQFTCLSTSKYKNVIFVLAKLMETKIYISNLT